MKPYVVLYRRDDVMTENDNPFAFSCWADDVDHAEEQLLNADPDAIAVYTAQSDDVAITMDEYDHTCIGEAVIMEAREVTHTRSCLAVLENLIFYGLTRYDDKPHQFWNQMRIAAEFVGNVEAAELFNEYYENGCPFNRSPQPIQSDIELLAFAKGYWDGRLEGADTLSGGESDEYRHYYRRGYDRGVFDYCVEDIKDNLDTE